MTAILQYNLFCYHLYGRKTYNSKNKRRKTMLNIIELVKIAAYNNVSPTYPK
jgi:hypothetical protein